MDELRPVPGWPGYAATADGRVFSLRGSCVYRTPVGTPRELRGRVNRYGYRQFLMTVGLAQNGKQRTMTAHKIVALAFLPPPPPGLSPHDREIRHLDGNKFNNAASNLAYGTAKDNKADSRRLGELPRGDSHPGARLTEDDVRAIKRGLMVGETKAALARRFSISERNIFGIARGLIWQHVAVEASP